MKRFYHGPIIDVTSVYSQLPYMLLIYVISWVGVNTQQLWVPGLVIIL